jgi:type II secretory pathway pseudopilin PulG
VKSRSIASFTLIELMAATAVLSSVLLLMVGMQDQMSRAWNNANRRTETGREARAALRMMASDLAALKTRRATSGPVANLVAGDVISGPIPFYYYGGGAGSVRLTISQRLAGASFLFGVVPKANGELNLVGYYVARRTTTNLNGLVQDNAHLMRYRRDAAATASSLSAYFGNTSSASALFSGINSATDEILAYNVAGLSILAMGDTTIINSNGLNFTLPEVTNQGCRFHVTLHLYPEEIAQRLSASDWTNSANLSKFSRSYEFRLRPLTRPQE